MKRYYYYIFLLLGLCACQDESIDGFGYLQLSSVELNKTVIPASRAAGESTERLALDILKNGVIVKHTDDWKTLQGESLLLPTGRYVLKAYSVAKDSMIVGFQGQPFYVGVSEVVVEKDVAKPAEVVCSLAQCMVSVHYTDHFKQNFKSYTCRVENSYGTADFVQNETRSAYYPAAAMTATLSLTNTDNKSFVLTQKIPNVKARYHYNIHYDVTTEGDGSFNITVDQTTHNYIVNIVVPLTSSADPKLHTGNADAWGQFAYLSGTSELTGETEPIVFQYKKPGDINWSAVSATAGEAGAYTAKTLQLDFGTDYNFRIACGAKVGTMGMFTTETFQEVPNLKFDTWVQKGKNWYANPVANCYDDPSAYWANGNEGVTSSAAGSNPPITIPVEGAEAYRGKAAKLTTITGVTLVKSAAGNLFIGKYKTNIMKPAASVSFGRPYSGARPVVFSGYYKYTPKPINEGTYPGSLMTDECHIYIRLWDAGGKLIGSAELIETKEVATYTRFSLPIVYTDLKAKPASMTIVATSSHYGGEFSGAKVVGQVGAGSTLWVDEFELSYYK
ncbi:MAG: DUF4493 domain-containing protein [Odoribacter sp.]